MNDEPTISSNSTVDTLMDTVESYKITMNTNIGNLYNSVNYMSRILAKFMKEMKQYTKAPVSLFHQYG